MALAFGSAAYPRPFATALVVGAALLLMRGGKWGSALIAGVLLSVAFTSRYSEGILLLPLTVLAMVTCQSGARAVRGIAVGSGFALGSIVLVGAFDWLTWGRPFASLLEFARYTLVEHGSSSEHGVQPWHWYIWAFFRWVPFASLPLLWLGWRHRAGRLSALFVANGILWLSLVHHKELRYLQALVPFLALWAASGVESLLAAGRRRLAAALVIVAVASGIYQGTIAAAKRSAAAVDAARAIAAKQPHTVVLTQAWAFGHLLYLGPGVGIRDLPPTPTPDELRSAARDADHVALYADVAEADPTLVRVLAELGFHSQRRFEARRSRPVLVFSR